MFFMEFQKLAFYMFFSFKNGSLTRERIKDKCSEGSWDRFAELLQSTPMGNNGNIGIYFDITEIQPLVSGDYRFNSENEQVNKV
ncbi:hypothetical protein KUTeg_015159 [Tegillarca granosa]|uniref:Uncharacterized protein n=1 Tax=Tegillarca granosa TaxID=220873 RepID=A0ABQ9ETX0_TEGGR|nr:hypothetical protein KUTeg_015159 [Tegillarca granosa]